MSAVKFQYPSYKLFEVSLILRPCSNKTVAFLPLLPPGSLNLSRIEDKDISQLPEKDFVARVFRVEQQTLTDTW